jgi:hypothetical protein
MPEEFIIKVLEQAPVVATLLFLVYRQEKRLSELQEALIELICATRAKNGQE